MKKVTISFLTTLVMVAGLISTTSQAATTRTAQTLVRITTSAGTIDLELYPDKAPKTVKNFLTYVDKKAYDGLIFHRVMAGFMIQGGGFDARLNERASLKPIENEADNGLKNTAGTIAMARTNEPDSASNQFFINTVDNAFLDFRSKTPMGWGYAVFGKVVSGMNVIKAIESSKTRVYGRFQNLPTPAVTILKIRRVQP